MLLPMFTHMHAFAFCDIINIHARNGVFAEDSCFIDRHERIERTLGSVKFENNTSPDILQVLVQCGGLLDGREIL